MTGSVSYRCSGSAAELGLLIDDLTSRLQAGEAIDLDAVLAEHPDRADELRKLLPALQLLADVAASGGPVRADGAVAGTLGDFRLIGEVGRGGMGVVYEAEQISLSRRVALKVLPFAATMDPRQLQRFHNEAKAAASLHHEHIVPVYAVGCERGVHYYAMQFIDGITLAAVIAGPPVSSSSSATHHALDACQPNTLEKPVALENEAFHSYSCDASAPAAPTAPIALLTTERGKPKGRDKFRRAAALIADAADALEYAHSVGIVHRDVKPGNLMIDAAGKLWVTDFGLARFGTDAGLTMTGDMLGTLRYMAPEQALAKHGLVDHRTDVYGLGATLYELLTREPAVGGEDKQEILRRIAFEEPVTLRKLDRSIPAELETITLKCLAKEPTERYATVGELAADLWRFLSDQPIRVRPPTALQRGAKWFRRHRTVMRAGAVALAATLLGMGVCLALLARAWDAAEGHRAAAERQAAALRLRVYAADMRRAYDFWRRGAVDDVAPVLSAYEPKPGTEDLRGFEWHHLKRLAEARPVHRAKLPAGHGVIYAAVFSPDGQWIATTGEQSAIDLWDARTFERRARLVGHIDDCNGLAFTPDSGRLVSCGDDRTVRIWDVAAGKQVGQPWFGHEHVIQKVAVSPDGRLVASAGYDSTVRLWDVARGEQIDILRGGGGPQYAVAFSPDGKALACGTSQDDRLGVWDIQARRWHNALENSPRDLRHCAFSPDGKFLAAATVGGVMVWSVGTGQLLHALNPDGICYRYLAFGPDSSYLAACGDDGLVRVWAMSDGGLLGQFRVHEHFDYPRVRSWGVAVSPDGRSLLTASGDQRADLWQLPVRWARHEYAFPSTGGPMAVAPNAPAVAFDYADDPSVSIHLFDYRTGARPSAVLPNRFQGGANVPLLRFSADERWLACWVPPAAGEHSPVRMWDVNGSRLADQSPLRPEPDARPHALIVVRGGRSVMTVYPNSALVEWDREAGTTRRYDGAPAGELHALAGTPDGRLAVITGDSAWRIWDTDRGDWAGPGGRLAHGIRQVCISADGRLLAACDGQGTVRLVDTADGRERAAMIGARPTVDRFGMDFSPDGRTLATAGAGMVRLWHVATGEELFALDFKGGGYITVRFRTDGRGLVAAVADPHAGRLVVWEGAPSEIGTASGN